MKGLLDMPNEVISETALYIPYEQAQRLRLVCKRTSKAIEHIALSRLTISWDGFTTRSGLPPVRNIPVSKLEAYSSPGHTPAFGLVQHLNIFACCSKFMKEETTLDDQLAQYGTTNCTTAAFTEKRFQLFCELLRKCLQGGALGVLKTVRWNVSSCEHYGYDDDDDDDDDEDGEGEGRADEDEDEYGVQESDDEKGDQESDDEDKYYKIKYEEDEDEDKKIDDEDGDVENKAKGCQAFLNQIVDWISNCNTGSPPLHRFEVNWEWFEGDDWTFDGALPSRIPKCRTFATKGFWMGATEEINPDYMDELYSTIFKLMNSSSILEFIDTDAGFNADEVAKLYPATGASKSYIQRQQQEPDRKCHQHLNLNLTLDPGFKGFQPQAIDHFRSLRRIHISSLDDSGYDSFEIASESEDNFLTQSRSAFKSLWRQLLSERIFVEIIDVHINEFESGLVNYLSGYPQPVLKELKMRGRDDSHVIHAFDVAHRFYSRALPAIAAGLKHLTIECYSSSPFILGYDWGHRKKGLQGFIPSFRNCTALESVTIPVEAQNDVDIQKNTVFHAFSGSYPKLTQIHVIRLLGYSEISWDYEEALIPLQQGRCLDQYRHKEHTCDH